MSDTVNSSAPKANSPAPEVEVKPIDINKLSGAEASALVAKAKAEGKTVEEILSGGATDKPAPKQSSQDLVKEAAKDAIKEIRKHKVKVDGQEIEVDEEELKRGYAHQKAANKKLQEGLAARKQAEEFISLMRDKQKLFDVIKKLGHDPRQLSEEFLTSVLEDEMLDPREKELRDAKSKLKAIEDMDRKRQEQVQAQRDAEMKQKYMKEYETQFVEALQKSQLPPNKAMVAEMAKYISKSAKIGFKMTPDEAAQLVKEDVLQAHQRLIGDSDGEVLIKLLGENVANKIRKYDTQKIKTPAQFLQTPRDQHPREERSERTQPKKRMTTQEWRLHKKGLK